MPVLHWRDQAKLDEKNRRLGRKITRKSSDKYKVIIDDENQRNNLNDFDGRAESEQQMQKDSNIELPGSPIKQKRLTKMLLEENVPTSNAAGEYDTVDTVTGPSADELENNSVNSEEVDNEGLPTISKQQQESAIEREKRKKRKLGDESEIDGRFTTDDEDGPECDSDNNDEIQSGYGSSLDYDIDFRKELSEYQKKDISVPEIDTIKLWRDQRAEDLASKAMRQCMNCDKQLAAWRCHGCAYTYCEECNRDVHMFYCMKFRKKDHVLQRIDGKALECGRCRKGVWEIAKHGYDHFNHQYKKKRREMEIKRMKEEMDILKEIVSLKRSEFKKERKGHRLRQAQLDKLNDMMAEGKRVATEKINEECDKHFSQMMTPLLFDPSQLELELGENGHPIIPPRVDKESGRSVSMFSFDFNRNSILCRACNIFWNSGPLMGRRVVVNAYAPAGPIIDPQAAARRTVQRIHTNKIHEKLMEKLRLEALEKERLAKMAKPSKKRACVIM
jgi:hypothetical protein